MSADLIALAVLGGLVVIVIVGALLFVRSALSQMDVPTRSAFVMELIMASIRTVSLSSI